jgi:hypothetical protein
LPWTPSLLISIPRHHFDLRRHFPRATATSILYSVAFALASESHKEPPALHGSLHLDFSSIAILTVPSRTQQTRNARLGLSTNNRSFSHARVSHSMSSSSSRSKSTNPSRRHRHHHHHQHVQDEGSYRHSMDSVPVVQVSVLRCLRCARTEEATSTDDASALGMVRVGQGIYYCKRCAKLVGYK